MNNRSILERDISGEAVSSDDPEYPLIRAMIDETAKLVFELNSAYRERDEARRYFSRITGVEVDETFLLRTPFYTDIGRNIRVGKNVFVNHNCTFMDRGGITLEDRVMIAPRVSLITLNHLEDPSKRRFTVSRPITIKRNAWLGLGVTVTSGVTIGENSIIAAGSVVTRDIPPNVIAAGVPAKVIRPVRAESRAGEEALL